MPGSQSDQNAAEQVDQKEREPRHPINHVVGVLENSEQTACAVDALTSGGFLESEVKLLRGPEEAERLDAGTGRRGLADLVIRLGQSVGLENADTEMKERYEEALRNGRTVVAVLAPTDERKDRAVQILQECGGHFINFFGRLSVERITQ